VQVWVPYQRKDIQTVLIGYRNELQGWYRRVENKNIRTGQKNYWFDDIRKEAAERKPDRII
jgi:RecG-like helicase